MTRTIAINGAKLDKVRMLLVQQTPRTISYTTYPKRNFRLSGDENTLCLGVPAFLAVELYRTGILPQDANLPLEIAIDGHTVGWFRVSDMRYTIHSDGPFPQVNFTFSRVVQEIATSDTNSEPVRKSASRVEGTYITDIRHYLDETGELMTLPGPARKLASFLTLVIEAATGAASSEEHDTGIRCRKRSCHATIRASFSNDEEILWHCPACEHNGVIRNWQNTKWNQRKRPEEP